MRALSSMPFCSCDGRQASLWYLPARWRDTTDQANLYRIHSPVLHDGLLTTTFGLGRCTFHNQHLLPKAVIDSATNMVSFRPDEKHSCYVCTWGCWRHRATNSGPPRRRPLLVVPVMPDADSG